MNTIEIEDKVFNVPSTWDELSDNQLSYVMKSYFVSIKGFNRVAFLSQISFYFLNYKPSRIWRARNSDKIEDCLSAVVQLSEKCFAWMLNENGSLSWNGITVPFNNGISPLYQNITFGKFVECSQLIGSINENNGNLEQVTKELTKTKLVPWKEYFTVLQFVNTINHIQTQEINILGMTIHFGLLFGRGRDDSEANSLGWFSVRCWLLESKVFGNYKEIDDTPLWEVFLYVYNQYITNKNEPAN